MRYQPQKMEQDENNTWEEPGISKQETAREKNC